MQNAHIYKPALFEIELVVRWREGEPLMALTF